MFTDEYVESLLQDADGNCFDLILRPSLKTISNEDFIPDEFDYPDAYRYMVISKEKSVVRVIEGIELKELVVQRLKKNHGMKDPWDDDLDYFKDRCKPDINIPADR